MIKKAMFMSVAAALLFALPVFAASDQDTRQMVKLPDMMKQHMLGNMRDHLLALHDIQVALAKGELDKAGDIAEQRIGMSSLASHNAAHMAPYMPKAMQDIGTEMHHSASRFAMTAKEGDTLRALDSLSKVTQQCVACHAAYRLN
ncbi:MAG TPA: hypothetical protein VMV97_11945 [Sulfuriferula sp.]|nr:hypothetical protein [Sulfuriferula sp.]